MKLSFIEIRILIDYYEREIEFCQMRTSQIKNNNYLFVVQKEFELEAVRKDWDCCEKRIKELEEYKQKLIDEAS